MSILLYNIPFYIIDIMAYIIGNIIYYSGNWRVRAIENNVYFVTGKHIKSKQVFINMTRNFLDFIKLHYYKKEYIYSIVNDNSWKSILENKDKQYILLTAHFTNWELGGIWLSKWNRKFVTIAESKGPGEKLFSIYKKLRSKEGTIILRLEDKNVSIDLLHYIKDGYLPVLLIDRDIIKNGEKVKFGNKNCYVPKGPYVYGNKFGYDYLFGYFYKIKHEKYRYKADHFIINNSGNKDIDMKNIMNSFSKLIKQYSFEWYAFDMRWEE